MTTPELSGPPSQQPLGGPIPTPSRRRTEPSPDGAAWWAGGARPVRTAIALAAAPLAVTLAIGIAGRLAFPGADPIVVRLVAVLALVAMACAVVARAGAWRAVGAAGPATWSRVGLLAVPALVALAPLVTGLDLPAPGILLVLVTGYAATGVFEEVWHRGVILDTLRSLGVRRSAVIGGGLFAASHLANVVFGQAVAVSAAQAVGAFCFGIGFAVLRWRTNAVWLLAAIHFAGDLLLQVTGLHGGMLWVFLVGHDTLMLLWGLWCLRGLPDDVSLHRPVTARGGK